MNFKKIKYSILFFIIFIAFFNIASAANLKDAFRTWDDNMTLDEAKQKAPLSLTGIFAGYKTEISPDYKNLDYTIATVIQAALSFLGVVFVILIIYGGYQWMYAKGNQQQVEKAKEIIMASIIGLIIVVAAYALSYFVLSKLTGPGTGILQ